MVAAYAPGRDRSKKMHALVDALNDAEADAALIRLTRERVMLREWADADRREATHDAWAVAVAREAIRKEPW